MADFDPIANGATEFDPIANGATPVKQGGNGGFWENALGTVGATAGHIEGIPGALLSFGTDNPITAGAVGGGIGGTIGAGIDDLVSGKGLNWGHIAKGGLSQGAYGAIPGGDEVKAIPLLGRLASNVVGRTALRAGAGAAGNSAAQFVQKGQVDPIEALESGGINAALPGGKAVLDNTLGKVFGFAGKRVPQDIRDLIAKGQLNVQNLINRAHGEMVGHNNLDFAKANNILDADHEFTTQGLNTAKERTDTLANKTEAQLQQILKDQMLYKNPSEFMPGLLDIPLKHGLSPDMPELEQIHNILGYTIGKDLGYPVNATGLPSSGALLPDIRPDMSGVTTKGESATSQYKRMGGVKPGEKGPPGYLKEIKPPAPGKEPLFAGQATSEMKGAAMPLTQVLTDVMNGNYPVGLSTINSLKRILGQNYKNSPVHREMYHYLKNYIENSSEKGGIVSQLNQKAGKLMDIKDILNKHIDAKQTPNGYDPVSIAAAKEKIGIKHPVSLNVLLGALGAAGGAALGGLTHGLGLGPVGEVLEPLLGAGLASTKVPLSQGAQEKIANTLSGMYQRGETALNKAHLDKIFQQLGVRLPGAFTDQ